MIELSYEELRSVTGEKDIRVSDLIILAGGICATFVCPPLGIILVAAVVLF